MKRILFALLVFTGAANAQTLRIGLAEAPDVLDPTLARTFVGRIVFSALCDKLFDLDEKLNIVPMLATSHQWSADNKALTMKSGQTHVQRYTRPLLEKIRSGEIDPSFVITHTVPLEKAPQMYKTFRDKKDGCIKVVLKP